MKKLHSILACTIVILLMASCGQKSSQAYYDFSSKIIATELDGSYTIRAFGRARNAVDAYEQAQKQAVRDVIFKGVASATSQVKPLKALLLEVNAEEKYEDYFNVFFVDNGEYTKYITKKERRLWSSEFARTDIQSTAEVTVCVHRTELKQKLIQDGILK